MRAAWDFGDWRVRSELPSPRPLLVVVLGALACAIGVFLIGVGGTKWEVVGLFGVVCAMGFAAWLLLERRFIDAVTVFLSVSVPVLIDVELWAAHGWSYIAGWPQGFALTLSDIFLAIVGVAWFFDVVLRRGNPAARLGWAGHWLWLFLFAALWFPIHSSEPTSSFIDLTKLARYMLVFAYLAKRIEDRDVLRWIVIGVAAQVWVQGLISMVQYVTGSSLGLDFLGERGGVKTFMTDEGANPRAGGLMGHPNNLALFLTLVGPLMLAMTLYARTLWSRLAWGATYLVLNVALLLTFSRLGWVCAVVGFFAVYHLIQRHRGQPLWLSLGLPLFTSLIVFLALFVGFETFRDRLLDDDRGSAESRIEQFKTAIEVIRNWPLAGTGIGSYVDGAARFMAGQGRSARAVVMRVHNGSLMTAAELGLLGALAYHAWYYVVVRRGYGIWRHADPELAAIGTGVFVGLVAWFIKSMYNVHTLMGDAPVWLFAALMVVIGRFAARRDAPGTTDAGTS